MRKRDVLLIVWFAILCCLRLPAQESQFKVTGTVTDENGNAIPGATVQVKGKMQGVVTDAKGNYSISGEAGSPVLVFSCLGFETREIPVGAQLEIHAVLAESATEFDEVVVVGYGSQKKESVVAAMSSISAVGLKQTPASNLGIALAGRLPGLTVLQRSGIPGGESMEFYIRGRSTVNGQNPLTLVDGVERDFQALDPREVATISILKDASATAVYGVRGANGVILVTTRRGQPGKTSIDVTMEQSWQSPTRVPEMVSAYDYALLRNQIETQDGRAPIYDDVALEHYRLGDNQLLYPTRDFVNEYLRSGFPMRKANINVSGGSEKMRYFATVGYLYQEGLFKTEKFHEYDYDPKSKANRVNFRSNFDIELTSSLSMFLNVSGYMQKKNDPVVVPDSPEYWNDLQGYSVVMSNILTLPNNAFPTDTTPDGEVLAPSKNSGFTDGHIPYGMLNRTGFRNNMSNQVTTTLGAEMKLDFITKGLSVRAVASYDVHTNNQQVRRRSYQMYQIVEDPAAPDGVRYEPTGSQANSSLSDTQYQSFNNLFNIDASFNYARSFGVHDVTGMILFNRYQRTVNIELPYNYIGLVGRVTYGYKHRYLSEFNFGYNGSEQFAPGHKMGFFPSVSLGWVLSEEPFAKKAMPWLSYAKIRVSGGQVGNDNMGGRRWAFQTLWSGSHESQIGNEELVWEKSTKYNIGLDLRFLKDFSLELDLFKEKRDNILISADGLVPTGMFGTGGVHTSGIIPKINAGKVKNKGIEAIVGYQKTIGSDFRIDVKVNGAFNRNEVTYLSEVLLPEDYTCRLRQTGFRLGQPFGYKSAGFFNTEQEITDWYDQSALGGTPQLGDLKYMDMNGDGVINEKDQVPIGDPEMPEWTFGGALSVQYKGFDFSMMWQGVTGRSFQLSGQGVHETYNFNSWHKEAWSQERYDQGLPITYPRLSQGNNANKQPSDFWYVNGSYIRLKNIELGYTLPEKIARKISASSIRFYVNGLNLLTFDHYPIKYMDPEQNQELVYPVFKAYNIGLNISF